MATTAVSICSNALLMLGAQPINSLSEGNDRARLASNLWPGVRDDLLRSHPWNCAIKRVILSPESTAPAFDYAYQFALPGDLLRILSIGELGEYLEYRVEGRKILTDDNVLRLRYVFQNDNPATWDSAMVYAAELRMAAAMAYAITQSATLAEAKRQEAELAFRRAKSVDGQEEPGETVGDFRLLGVRR